MNAWRAITQLKIDWRQSIKCFWILNIELIRYNRNILVVSCLIIYWVRKIQKVDWAVGPIIPAYFIIRRGVWIAREHPPRTSICHRRRSLCIYEALATSPPTNSETTQLSYSFLINTVDIAASIVKFVGRAITLEYCVSVWSWDVTTINPQAVTPMHRPRPFPCKYTFKIRWASVIIEDNLELNKRLLHPISDNLILYRCVKVHIVVSDSWYHNHGYS